MLSIENHDRDIVHLRYVYPVVSRRAGGVSIGVNLNYDNHCNWQCVYCQVPDLKRGVAPMAEIARLIEELDSFLAELLHGDYMESHVPEGSRKLCDIAISGNGEPTTCPNFSDVVNAVVSLMDKYQLSIPLRLITNGSSVHKVDVQSGLKKMQQRDGEVWFKVDGVGKAWTTKLNGVSLSPDWQMEQLNHCAQACDTWLQTCVLDVQIKDKVFEDSYLSWLKLVLAKNIPLKGVLLYSLARPSLQPHGELVQAVEKEALVALAEKIESLGVVAKVA